MKHHMNRESNEAFSRLLDVLCNWERATGRRTTLLLIPHSPDEIMAAAVDGNPVRIDVPEDLSLLLNNALKERPEKECLALLTRLLGVEH